MPSILSCSLALRGFPNRMLSKVTVTDLGPVEYFVRLFSLLVMICLTISSVKPPASMPPPLLSFLYLKARPKHRTKTKPRLTSKDYCFIIFSFRCKDASVKQIVYRRIRQTITAELAFNLHKRKNDEKHSVGASSRMTCWAASDNDSREPDNPTLGTS